MLNRRESEVMDTVYTLCHDKSVCLISPTELLSQLSPRRHYTEEELERILSALSMDDYLEMLSSERKGEKMYVISLRGNGYAYKRNSVQYKRGIMLKLTWAVASAVIAFLVGVILKWIF